MANNNVQNVKFLRNGSVFTPSLDPVKTAREVALSAMEGQLNSLADGTAILGRYQETNGIVKTLVGVAYIGDTKTLTVFDVDGAGSDVDNKIKAAIEALDAEKTSLDGTNVQVKVTEVDGKITAVNITDNTVNSTDVSNAITTAINSLDYTGVTTGTGVYVTNVTEADGVIAATTASLPTVTAISEAGKPITAVSESLGVISATAGTINAEHVNVSYSAITATTVKGALAEIADEIDAMDKSADVVAGQVVTTVSESDGKVSETKANVKDLQLGGYAKSSSTGAIASTDTINEALSKLENKAAAITIANTDGSINVTTAATGTDINVNIKSGEHVLAKDGSAGVYTNIAISAATSEELSALGTNVQEAYKLVATDGTKLGEFIKIYKDSSLVNLYLGHVDDLLSGTTSQSQESASSVVVPGSGSEALVWIVQLANGNYKLAAVDVESFLQESEFASGVTADSATHIVHGVVDSASEKDESNVAFLTVGADGFKISGIKNEIDTKINALDATIGSTSVESGKHVAVQVVEDAGKLTALTVTENDIASAQGLADEITNRTTADTELSNRLGASVTTASTASAQLSALSGTSEDASGVTSVNGAKKYAQQYADEKVAAVVDALDATVSGETADGKVNVKVTEADGVITAVNVVGTDIASDSALAAEIAARKAVDGQTGQTYAANTSANYISGANSLNDADVKLDAALKIADDAMLTGVAAGNGIDIEAKANKSQTISAKVNGDGGIVNDPNGLHLGTIDCGTY